MVQGDKDGEIRHIFQPALGRQKGEVSEHGGLASAGGAQYRQTVESDQGLFGGHGSGFAPDLFTFPNMGMGISITSN